MSLGGGWRGRAFWDVHSLTWDSGVPSEVRTRRAAGTVAWLTALGVPPGGAVLDMGCATGDQSLALGRAGFEVVGVDVSRGMLRRAASKARGLSHGPSFQRVDLNHPLPFRSGAFDCVLCTNVLQCVEQPDWLLREARRVLVQGGWLAVVGKVPGARPSSPPAGAVGARLFAPLKALASRWARPLSEDALRDLVESAGFLGVTTRAADGRVALSGRAP
jgi:ubiquinone/menaquinone biosynthesis C-methylase UbiE